MRIRSQLLNIQMGNVGYGLMRTRNTFSLLKMNLMNICDTSIDNNDNILIGGHPLSILNISVIFLFNTLLSTLFRRGHL